MKMKKLVFFISILSSLLLNSNLADLFGFGDSRLTVSILLLIIFLVYEILNNKIVISYRVMPETCLIIMGCIIIIAEYIVGNNYVRLSLQFLFLPFVLSMYLLTKKKEYQSVLRYSIYIVLIIEILMVIYERLTYSVLLSTEDQYLITNSSGDLWSFRACGVYGHPLTGAMILSVTNIFVLVSDLKLKNKIFIFVSIFIGLFCLNERGNIVITFVSSIPFIFHFLNKQKGYSRFLGYFFIVLLSVFLFYGLAESTFGGRLFHHKEGFSDASSQQRLEAFDAFNHLNKDIVLWGFGEKEIILYNLTFAENGYINILLKFGVVLGIPLILFLLYYLYKRLYVYRWQDALLIAFVFLGIGLTNPQLGNPLQWLFFVVNFFAFYPNMNVTKIEKLRRVKNRFISKGGSERTFSHKKETTI